MTINEKIKYYREQHQYSQETLAEKLHVSRQTITKWEATSIPQIEYLVKLSDVFGITLDMLVRDEECLKNNQVNPITKNELITFLIVAKQRTYAAKQGKTTSSRLASIDYCFSEGDYYYLDTFLGSERFSGSEAIWYKGTPVWSMNYYGRVTEDPFSGDFLKEALMHVPFELPYRGPLLYQKGDFTYHCHVDGEFNYFNGKEEIFYKNTKVYELFFHGGELK